MTLRRVLGIVSIVGVLAAAGFPGVRGERTRPADLVLLNGTVATLDPSRPRAEALAVREQVILAVGSNREIQSHIGPSTRIIDLDGMFAMPGFIEGHGHLVPLGYSRMQLDLRRASSWEEIVELVRSAAAKAGPGEWVLGSGWHQEKWSTTPAPEIEGYPTHESLSRVSPQNPVWLTHASGHAGFANARAMELAGVTRETPDPPGGAIVKDLSGNPTGVFLDTAQGLIDKAIESHRALRSREERSAEERRAIGLATDEALSKGITSFQDASSSFETIDLFKQLAEERKLGLRLWVMIREGRESLVEKIARYRIINFGESHLTVRAIKNFMDGALGSHTAWLLEPYTDLPSSTGLSVDPPEDILANGRLAMAAGFQLCTHAIGDRANREALNIYERLFKESPDKRDLRWRIEHAQHLSREDVPRFARLGVIASMQAVHAVSDGPWVVKRLGAKRAEKGAYLWRDLIDSGAVVTNGTDTPVEDIDPIPNYYAAVTRRLADGSSFYPAQCMSREEALRAYTINNAYAAFEEDIKGSLVAGKLADITVLSKNILTAPVEEILQARVAYTIVGGEVMYRRHER